MCLMRLFLVLQMIAFVGYGIYLFAVVQAACRVVTGRDWLLAPEMWGASVVWDLLFLALYLRVDEPTGPLFLYAFVWPLTSIPPFLVVMGRMLLRRDSELLLRSAGFGGGALVIFPSAWLLTDVVDYIVFSGAWYMLMLQVAEFIQLRSWHDRRGRDRILWQAYRVIGPFVTFLVSLHFPLAPFSKISVYIYFISEAVLVAAVLILLHRNEPSGRAGG